MPVPRLPLALMHQGCGDPQAMSDLEEMEDLAVLARGSHGQEGEGAVPISMMFEKGRYCPSLTVQWVGRAPCSNLEGLRNDKTENDRTEK